MELGSVELGREQEQAAAGAAGAGSGPREQGLVHGSDPEEETNANASERYRDMSQMWRASRQQMGRVLASGTLIMLNDRLVRERDLPAGVVVSASEDGSTLHRTIREVDLQVINEALRHGRESDTGVLRGLSHVWMGVPQGSCTGSCCCCCCFPRGCQGFRREWRLMCWPACLAMPADAPSLKNVIRQEPGDDLPLPVVRGGEDQAQGQGQGQS